MNTECKRLLLVEDNPADARLLTRLLAEGGSPEFEIHHVDRISKALKQLAEGSFDGILLDLSLPDGSGLGTVRRMCAVAGCIPIIVLTALEDDALAVQAVQAGAQDYLVKWQVEHQTLVRAMRYAIQRKRTEERLQYLATHDDLTDLPNRTLFHDRLLQAVERARRNRNGKSNKWETAIMLLDLDYFKTVNDTLGHNQGDVLLQAVANRLQQCIRKSDTVARMGGDEFTLIFENVTGRDDAEILARRILAVFAQPFQLADQEWKITASLGISLYPCDGEDAESLLKYADIAMYYAKRVRNRYCFYHLCKDEL